MWHKLDNREVFIDMQRPALTLGNIGYSFGHAVMLPGPNPKRTLDQIRLMLHQVLCSGRDPAYRVTELEAPLQEVGGQTGQQGRIAMQPDRPPNPELVHIVVEVVGAHVIGTEQDLLAGKIVAPER